MIQVRVSTEDEAAIEWLQRQTGINGGPAIMRAALRAHIREVERTTGKSFEADTQAAG